MSNNNFESNENRSFTDFCKDFIKDKLWEFEGETVEISNLGYLLTEEINKNGSYFNSTEESISYLKKWRIESVLIERYQLDTYGRVLAVQDKSPDKWIACMITEGVYIILMNTKFIGNLMCEEDFITLTKNTINAIITDIEECNIF